MSKMRKTLLTLIAIAIATTTMAQKVVGGDLSLVPAYEAAGDQWLDASGNVINTTYSDGMITYVRDVAKWNSVRVRLLVDPTKDDAPATCQDLDYVKILGKRIKDAGMSFLLDIFYSDTWTDVSKQWIPTSWEYNKSTSAETLAAKVKSYTTEVLNALVNYGAKPDYIQLGNEVSYGMLWDSMTGADKSNWFITSSSYAAQETKIKRFVTLLKAAKEGVDVSTAADAKIILHCERTKSAAHCVNFYSWVEKAGFTDYDIIGLSYYPIWHGTLTLLKSTLQQLVSNFPNKQIQIVETGYQHTAPEKFGTDDTNTSSDWPYSPAGQASFLESLITELKKHTNVTGLYYWQPEECGNGADTNGNNRVMGNWDNRGFWNITWKSGQHALNSKDALMTLMTFIDEESSDITSKYLINPSFDSDISGWTNTGGTAQWKQNTWAPLSNYCEFAWTGSAIVDQEVVQSPTLPAGSYKLTFNCATDNGATGLSLIAGDKSTAITGTGNVEAYSVEFSIAAEGSVKVGLKLQNTTATWINFDNFSLEAVTTGISRINEDATTTDDNWYSLSGRKINGKPTAKGIYIHQHQKKIVR